MPGRVCSNSRREQKRGQPQTWQQGERGVHVSRDVGVTASSPLVVEAG